MEAIKIPGEYHNEWHCGRGAFNILLHILDYIIEEMYKLNEAEYNGETPMAYKLTIESVPGQQIKFSLDGKEYKKPEQECPDFKGSYKTSDT